MIPQFQSTRNLTVSEKLPKAGEILKASLDVIGKFKGAEEMPGGKLKLSGNSFFGLQRIKLQVELEQITPEVTQLSIIALADDIKAIGAKKCIDRLLEVYNKRKTGWNAEPGTLAVKDRFLMMTGMRRHTVAAIVLVFLVFICVLVYGIFKFDF